MDKIQTKEGHSYETEHKLGVKLGNNIYRFQLHHVPFERPGATECWNIGYDGLYIGWVLKDGGEAWQFHARDYGEEKGFVDCKAKLDYDNVFIFVEELAERFLQEVKNG